MIRLGKKKTSFSLTMLPLLLLTGCSKYYLSLTDRKIDVNYLASTHVATPDKRQKNPPYGDMIVMDWRIPKDILERQPIIKLHVLYGNYTEKTLDYPIKSRMGFATYKDLDKEYADTKGIITYSAEIVLDDGEIYKSWKHQLWVKLITLDEEPKDTQLSSFAGSDEVFEEEDVISYQEDEELFDEEQEDLSSISADSISASVDDQPIQGSVIDTEDLIDDTSSEID